jgi:ribonuclease HII
MNKVFHLKKILSNKRRKSSSWSVEKKILSKYKNLVSIDEVGRGSLAGPLIVCGVYLSKRDFTKINSYKIRFFDSKLLSFKERKIFVNFIKNFKIKYKIIKISNQKIDKIGINQAFILAIFKIIKYFKNAQIFLIDGKKPRGLNFKNCLFFIKGDRKLSSISMSSILAKNYRDNLMIKISKKYPDYLFDLHKGYGTKKHIQLIKELGYTPFHRKSFLKNIF